MKELSIEEKAKAYDEAIERAKGLVDFCSDNELKTLEFVFSELKESGDIGIIKAIKYGLDHVFTNNTTVFEVTKEQCLAWLEKQGETFTKKDVDNAYIEGMAFAKDELEKQKPTWSVDDTFKVQRICKYLDEAKKYYADITEVRDCIDWLKSLKQRIGG